LQKSDSLESTGKADLHIHTAHSDGMADIPELLEHVETQTDLDVIAIVDHDDLRPAWVTRDVWARGHYRFQVIIGMEVTAIEGHLLALFLEDPVPSLRPIDETLEDVHRRGGLCIVPHPMSWLTRSLDATTLSRINARRTDGVYFDGIETANQTPGARHRIAKAAEMNRRSWGLAEVGGSDAHFLSVIASAYTAFPGRTADDLRRAILDKTTRGVNARYPSLREMGALAVLRQSWRGLRATPRAVGWGPTALSFVRRIFRLPVSRRELP
jgi:predicted metal-dependent phosphoesterase TrpH